ncbi:hypothetical protein EOD39_13558 [Acipenser ruthenus]|uniref:Uncharacterized protein n=1 Tax=Acipenser ruthenus TaxID=7906 RepID=A0A444UIB1_ACIRT|nr:hypothetical protein EOD39_13558 [Acipenser ruthenus]
MTEAEFNIVKSQAATADMSAFVNGEEVNSLKQKIEELEAEHSWFEELNNILEKHNIQSSLLSRKLGFLVMEFLSYARVTMIQPKPNEPSESAAQIAVQAAPGVCLGQAGGAVPAVKEDVNLSLSQVVMGTMETGKRKTKAFVQTCFK